MALRLALQFDGQNEAALMQGLERDGFAMNVFDHASNFRLGLMSFAERDHVRAAVSEVHRGHLVDVDHGHMVVREGNEERKVPVADASWFVNCTSHLRQVPHEPVLQDGEVVCAPQFILGFSGTSAYYATHLWYRGELGSVAPQLFRGRLDVQPKLRFGPQVALMIMANLAIARLPLSIVSKFRGDMNKWYPLSRRVDGREEGPGRSRVREARGGWPSRRPDGRTRRTIRC